VHTTSTAAALEQYQSLILSIFCFWTVVQQSNPIHLKQHTIFQQSTKQIKWSNMWEQQQSILSKGTKKRIYLCFPEILNVV
jgi:hypothetical protein